MIKVKCSSLYTNFKKIGKVDWIEWICICLVCCLIFYYIILVITNTSSSICVGLNLKQKLTAHFKIINTTDSLEAYNNDKKIH